MPRTQPSERHIWIVTTRYQRPRAGPKSTRPAFWGGVGIPTLEILALLLAPYLDRKQGGVGTWFARERLLANSLFLSFVVINIVLMVVGTFFRGPNWEFVSPW